VTGIWWGDLLLGVVDGLLLAWVGLVVVLVLVWLVSALSLLVLIEAIRSCRAAAG
jgi:hypothetical protein